MNETISVDEWLQALAAIEGEQNEADIANKIPFAHHRELPQIPEMKTSKKIAVKPKQADWPTMDY